MLTRRAALLLTLTMAAPLTSIARIVPDPARIGAFSGAMRYCEQRYDEKERRYRWARINAADEVSRMNRDDRLRALAASRISFENGRYLGNRLNRNECRALLSMSEWRRFWRN